MANKFLKISINGINYKLPSIPKTIDQIFETIIKKTDHDQNICK
jgi:hypothetical protein